MKSKQYLIVACVVLVPSLVDPLAWPDSPLQKVKTPSLSSFIDADPGTVNKISNWMSQIVVATAANSFECSVECELARTGWVGAKEKPVEFAVFQTNCFRLAKQIGTGVERSISSSQPSAGHEFSEAEFLREIESLDVFRKDGKVLISGASGLGPYGSVKRIDVSDGSRVPEMQGLFHPAYVCVLPVVQSITGGAMNVSRHSILAKYITGTITNGEYTHAVVAVGTMRFLVTFRAGCPIQFEVWRMNNGDPLLTDIVRSEWTEVAESLMMPRRIHGIHTSSVRSAEFHARVSWRFGEQVDEQVFDEATVGLLMPEFVEDARGR